MGQIVECVTRQRTKLAAMGRGAGFAVLTAGALVSLAACSSSESSGVNQFDVGAQIVDNSGDPVPGVQVQVWIVDVDQSAAQRQPLPMNPRITTGTNGYAVWMFQAVSEPVVCGYQVLDTVGTLLVEETPDKSKDFGPNPGFVTITLDR